MNDFVPEKLLKSKKYSGVCPDTVKRIWAETAPKYKKASDAEHAVREALHGITGAFMSSKERKDCFDAISLWKENADACQLEKALSCHASTRERLPLESAGAVFDRIFAGLPEGFSVLDLACGIDPIYLAARGIRTMGMDISGDAVELINEVGMIPGMQCSAVCADLLCEPSLPSRDFDVVLLFKVLPLLERQRKNSALELLNRIESRRIVVSFPTRSLSGRSVGMEDHYTQWMESHIPSNRKTVCVFTSPNELFYVLDLSEVDS